MSNTVSYDLRTMSDSELAELSSVWHDQVLDLESIRLDKAKSRLEFRVRELDEGKIRPCLAIGPIGFFRAPFRWCHVTIRGVSECGVDTDEEVELHVTAVTFGTDASCMSIKGVHAHLHIEGPLTDLELRYEHCLDFEGWILDLILFQVVSDKRLRSRSGKPVT